jgi:SNF family Na+-dependent transporter
MTAYICLIIGALLLGGIMVYSIVNLDEMDSFFVCMLSALTALMFFLGGYMKSEKDTAIKCLKDNNPYKMEIIYELKDSVYVPKDTIYIKK